MDHRVVVTFLIVLMVAILTTIWCCNRVIDSTAGFSHTIDRAYKSLRNGMTKEEVFERMGGPPIATNEHFLLGPGSQRAYAKTNGVNFKTFYLWNNGIGSFYCIGFDEQDRVVVKGMGGS